MARSRVKLKKDLSRSIRRGHPWVYREALVPVKLEAGALVEVLAKDGRRLATGFWDAESAIAVRVLSVPALGDAAALVRERLAAAWERRRLGLDLQRTNAFRWVHGEADALPGIHVDVYGDVATVRYDAAGARAFYEQLAEDLLAIAGGRIARIVDRDDRRSAGELEVIENGIRFRVDLAHGQKGGLFLDQRDNRAFVESRAAGLRVLNLFGYTGGFSLYAARGGAARTDTVDVAKPAIEAARRNFTLNDFAVTPDKAGFFAEDAFDFLTRAASDGTRWDLVVCDPPSFAPRRSALPAARAAYRRLYAAASRVVAPGGTFCPASCSSQLSRQEFLDAVRDGVRAAGRRFELEELRGAGSDHPVLATFPEGEYLKFAVGRLR